MLNRNRKGILLRGSYNVQIGDKNQLEIVAKCKMNEPFQMNFGARLKSIRKFFRIGTTPVSIKIIHMYIIKRIKLT